MNPMPFLSGVIEGFYGRPWTHAQRLALFAQMQAWGLNTYLYAPKDDLRHRHLWREPYPPAEAAELRELIAASHAAGVAFIYAVAPGLDPAYGSAAGIAALGQKVAQLQQLGCRHFAVLFDDIVPATASGLLGATAHDAAAQVEFAHQLMALQRTRDSGALLCFCPTPYCGRMAGPVAASSYLRHLGEALDPRIHVFWTGPEIVSAEITPASVRELATVLRRKPLIWDNLFANDYDLRRLYLGPFSGRPPALRNEVAGLLCNPNCEFAANTIPLRTLAAWMQNDDYDPCAAYLAAWREWQPAWRCVAPLPPATEEAAFPLASLELLGDCLHLPFAHGARAQAWLADFADLLGTPPAAWGEKFTRFAAECQRVERLFERLTRLEDRDLLHTVYRHVWELKEESALLLGYLRWLQSSPRPGETYQSAEHRPKTYRGGLVADFQRLLPLGEDGGFAHRRPRGTSP